MFFLATTVSTSILITERLEGIWDRSVVQGNLFTITSKSVLRLFPRLCIFYHNNINVKYDRGQDRRNRTIPRAYSEHYYSHPYDHDNNHILCNMGFRMQRIDICCSHPCISRWFLWIDVR